VAKSVFHIFGGQTSCFPIVHCTSEPYWRAADKITRSYERKFHKIIKICLTSLEEIRNRHKGTVTRFFTSGLFYESSSPGPLKIRGLGEVIDEEKPGENPRDTVIYLILLASLLAERRGGWAEAQNFLFHILKNAKSYEFFTPTYVDKGKKGKMFASLWGFLTSKTSRKQQFYNKNLQSH
jgi:hypothetical protein